MNDIAEKWGRPVAERGFAQIPNYLLLLNQFLGRENRLAPVELLGRASLPLYADAGYSLWRFRAAGSSRNREAGSAWSS